MKRRAVGLLIGIAILSATGLSMAQVAYTEVAGAAGLDDVLFRTSGQHALGLNWIDFNDDGAVDLFAVNGFNQDAHLWVNDRGSFERVDELLPDLPNYELMGSVFADYDNDGDSDIYIFTDHEQLILGPGNVPDGPPNLLLKNLWVENGRQIVDGQPLFEEVAQQAGVDLLADVPFGKDYPGYRSATGAWLDYDRDGWVDLYVGNWAVGNLDHPANLDKLFHNNQDGTFTDVSDDMLYANGDADRRRPALTVIGAHLDDDLWPDIYVGNVGANHLDLIYRGGTGVLADVMDDSPGCGDDSQWAMGLTVADIDRDGEWDLYMSDLLHNPDDAAPDGNPLYLGNGDGTFTDNTADLAEVQAGNSWGVNFFDADQDGYEDLFVCGKDVPNFMFANRQDGSFADATATSGLPETIGGRGSAIADYDSDGDLDIVAVYKNQPLRLYRNDTENPGNWLQVKLRGSVSNRDAIGAVATIHAGGLQQKRQVIGGSSAHSQDSLVLHFGLADAESIERLVIQWPSGRVTTLRNLVANQYREVTEPDWSRRMIGPAPLEQVDDLGFVSPKPVGREEDAEVSDRSEKSRRPERARGRDEGASKKTIGRLGPG